MEEAIALMPRLPSPSPVKNLTYIYEEPLSRNGEFGGSDFGGYPTLKQRNESHTVRESMSVHCGYVFGYCWMFLSHLPVLKSVYNLYLLIIKPISPTLLLKSVHSIFNYACVHQSDL